MLVARWSTDTGTLSNENRTCTWLACVKLAPPPYRSEPLREYPGTPRPLRCQWQYRRRDPSSPPPPPPPPSQPALSRPRRSEDVCRLPVSRGAHRLPHCHHSDWRRTLRPRRRCSRRRRVSSLRAVALSGPCAAPGGSPGRMREGPGRRPPNRRGVARDIILELYTDHAGALSWL